jgi:hypothetical protein
MKHLVYELSEDQSFTFNKADKEFILQLIKECEGHRGCISGETTIKVRGTNYSITFPENTLSKDYYSGMYSFLMNVERLLKLSHC